MQKYKALYLSASNASDKIVPLFVCIVDRLWQNLGGYRRYILQGSELLIESFHIHNVGVNLYLKYLKWTKIMNNM